MAVNKRDYYEVLGVARTATEQDLKSAYRRLAHQYHPDKNQGDTESEEKFKEAAEAYAVLSDGEQRQRYDRFGHAGVSSAAGAAWGAPGFGNIEDILGDLFGFGDVFGGGRSGSRRSSAQRGADLRYDLEITLEQAATGLTAQLRIPKLETCESCKGSGAKEGTQPEVCRTCEGAGQVRFQQGFFSVSRTCGSCRGAGQVITSPCETCRGAGRVENLYASVPITFAQAALGSEVSVKTLSADQSLKVPAGTQTGTVFRVRGQGMPVLGGRGKGDLFVSVSVVTPTMLNREQRKLLEQLAKIETPDLEDKKLVDKVRDIFG